MTFQPTTLGLLAQAAAEYGAMAGGSASTASGGGAAALLDRLPFDLTDPLVIGAAVLTVLIVASLFRTRRYRS
jgi:hypothetical protein